MRAWQAHKSRVSAMAFSPNGRALVTAARGEMNLAVWGALGGGRLPDVEPPTDSRGVRRRYLPECLAFSADSRYLAVGYGRFAGVVEWRGGEAAWTLFRWSGHGLQSVAFAPPDPASPVPDFWVAFPGRLHRDRAWGTDSSRPSDFAASDPAGRVPPLRVTISPDGQWVATNGYCGAVVCDAAGKVRFTRSHLTFSHNAPLAFSPDSATLALAHGNKVTLWDFATDAVPVVLVGHRYPVWGVGFSPDGTQIHTASSDGTVRSFDAATGRQLRALDLGLGALYAAAFSPDGLMGAAGSGDGRCVVWDLGE